jgi:hypothetical protein
MTRTGRAAALAAGVGAMAAAPLGAQDADRDAVKSHPS